MVHNGTVPYEQFLLTELGCDLPNASISVVFMVLYIYLILLHSLLCLLVSWAWWDCPLTWLTNHCPSVLARCWLGHLTHKIIPKMSYKWGRGMLKPFPFRYVSNYCMPVSKVTSRQHLRSVARHQHLLIPRYPLSTFGRRAFAVAGPTFWNSLADELQTYSSDRFKLALKTFLFANY